MGRVPRVPGPLPRSSPSSSPPLRTGLPRLTVRVLKATLMKRKSNDCKVATASIDTSDK